MDMPPPQPAVQQEVEVQNVNEIQEHNTNYKYPMPDEDSPEFIYWYYVLSRIDGPDIPDNVKTFAKDNNCFEVIKEYHWCDPFYKKEDVYSCAINGKRQYILVKNNKMKFANWFKRKKMHKFIYDM